MSVPAPRVFRLLAVEAIHDGVRRRIVPVIVVISLLSLLAIDSCTACASGSTVINGQTLDPQATAGWGGAMIFVVLGLWIMVLSGILASDHLVQTLADGSAALILSRPVGRAAFALARLTGALAIALGAGFVLLGATAVLMHARAGADLSAAVLGGAACALGSCIVAAFAMLGSLVLPRIATALVVLTGVAAVASVNLLTTAGFELSGLPGALDRFGPPLAGGLVFSVSPWIDSTAAAGAGAGLWARLVLWAAIGLAGLLFAFRRAELGR